MTVKISASLVLYNCATELFVPAITSFLHGVDKGVLIVVDNSEVPLSDPLFEHPRVRYIFNNSNVGFGVAHNRAIDTIASDSDYHLILNPDIRFGVDVIPHLISVMQANPEIGALMPRINYPDGSLQRLCKLLPTPVDLFLRRFIPIKSVQIGVNRRYELHDLPQDRLSYVPTISGCFLLVRTQLLRSIGGFDERYFMYLEDVDLVRRIGDSSKIAYDPRVCVTHSYAKGSYRNIKLLGYHLMSAVKYFTKWGWFFDSTRTRRNAVALGNIKSIELS